MQTFKLFLNPILSHMHHADDHCSFSLNIAVEAGIQHSICLYVCSDTAQREHLGYHTWYRDFLSPAHMLQLYIIQDIKFGFELPTLLRVMVTIRTKPWLYSKLSTYLVHMPKQQHCFYLYICTFVTHCRKEKHVLCPLKYCEIAWCNSLNRKWEQNKEYSKWFNLCKSTWKNIQINLKLFQNVHLATKNLKKVLRNIPT